MLLLGITSRIKALRPSEALAWNMRKFSAHDYSAWTMNFDYSKGRLSRENHNIACFDFPFFFCAFCFSFANYRLMSRELSRKLHMLIVQKHYFPWHGVVNTAQRRIVLGELTCNSSTMIMKLEWNIRLLFSRRESPSFRTHQNSWGFSHVVAGRRPWFVFIVLPLLPRSPSLGFIIN